MNQSRRANQAEDQDPEERWVSQPTISEPHNMVATFKWHLTVQQHAARGDHASSALDWACKCCWLYTQDSQDDHISASQTHMWVTCCEQSSALRIACLPLEAHAWLGVRVKPRPRRGSISGPHNPFIQAQSSQTHVTGPGST